MKEKIKAQVTIKDEQGAPIETRSCEVEYDFGEDLEGAVALCGEDTVFSQYRRNAVVSLQSVMRSRMQAGQGQEEIQAYADTWKPGMVAERVQIDPSTAVIQAWDTWDDEKKAAFLAGLGIE